VLRWIGGCLLVLAISIGSISDIPRPRPRLVLGGYEVLAADFHVHTFPLSWGVLAPWDTVLEARRNGLDVIAITPHNHTWVAKVAQWFSRWSGDPIVLVGEEIHSTDYHLLAIGIRNSIDWRQSATNAIADVHRQGGIAIAAHPIPPYTAYDAQAMQQLDGAEVVHPLALRSPARAAQLREFFGRAQLTAIGDTDYHFGPLSPHLGIMGLCRTYLFVRDRSERGILEALREGRTLAYDREHVYGDPALIQLAANDGRLPQLALTGTEQRFMGSVSRIFGVLGLLACTLSCGGTWARPRSSLRSR
jgi:predicted metal-dependent phosphoesterase TrpH